MATAEVIHMSSPSTSSQGIAAPPASSMIFTDDLWKTYEMGSEQVHALRGVNLRIERNEYVAIIGLSDQGPVLAQPAASQRTHRRRSGTHSEQGNRICLPDLQPAGPRHRAAQLRTAVDLCGSLRRGAHRARKRRIDLRRHGI